MASVVRGGSSYREVPPPDLSAALPHFLLPLPPQQRCKTSLSYKDPNCSSRSRRRIMNSPETQRSFIGSGHTPRLWPQTVAGMTSLFSGFDHPGRRVFTHRFLVTFPLQTTHMFLCRRAPSLHCCCAEERLAAGFRALMQDQPFPKASEAPHPPTCASPPKGNGRLSSQPSCMLKTIRHIVLNEEAGMGEDLIVIRIGGHLLEYVLKPGKRVTRAGTPVIG